MHHRIFRALLRLYPARFRDEYGREMQLVFADNYRNTQSPWQRAALWCNALAGIATEAPKEQCSMIRQDVHYALRMLRQNPLFAATVILTLALGIGANSAIFSLLNAVIMRTLPVDQAEQLYLLREDSPVRSAQRYTWPAFQRLHGALPEGSIAAMTRVARMYTSASGSNDASVLNVQLVSGEYFPVMRVPTVLGRALTADDNRVPGAHPVAVISYSYWQDHFAAAPDILGRAVRINNVPLTIVGVSAKGFQGVWLESPVQAWVPIAMQHDIRYGQNYSASNAETNKPWMTQERIWWLDVVVRTDSAAGAASRLNTAYQQELAQAAESMPDSAERKLFLQKRLVLDSFSHGFSALRTSFSTPLYALMAMAAMVLLIACANTANLLLARAAARQKEIALRLSLGAGRLRIVQQLLTEGLMLVAIAGALALLIARWVADTLIRLAANINSAMSLQAPIDARVLLFTAAVSLLTAIAFALVPALRTSRLDLTNALRAAGRGTTGDAASGTTRGLVVFQIALSLVLLAGTGLLIRSLQNLLHVDTGFDREHLLSVWMNPRLTNYPPAQEPEIYRQLIARVEQLPGVASASVAMCSLVSGCRSFDDGVNVEGYQRRTGEQMLFLTNIVGANYFTTVGMPLLAGRPFNDHDARGAALVAIVNQSAARKYFPGADAVGKRIGSGQLDTEVIGVVQDARTLSVKEAGIPMIYFPILQRRVTAGTLDVRTTGDPHDLAAAVRRIVAEAAPLLHVERVIAIDSQIEANVGPDRFVLLLTSSFGVLALGLAGFGLFGVLSYAVVRRTAEFGVRMALGAAPGRVIRDVLREALTIAAIGAAVGLLLALGAAQLASSMFHGVSPHDAATMFLAALIVLGGASLAGLLPAIRASRVDPVIALRNE